MQTEQLQKQNWMSLSGKILEGGFELKDLIEADETRALFRVRVLGDRELVATALFRRLDGTGADRQVELWQTVRHLRDPHLNSPLGSGVTDLNGVRMPYVVLRQPEESLAGVLRERPLTQAETKDALLNVAKGLEVLHLNGLVHGNVCPEEVVAIGDTIRLSGEGVRAVGTPPPLDLKKATYLAPESKAGNVTPESDVWSLGATVFETLTQKTWSESERETADALPEPFATIALRCLVAEPSERCRLAEVVALARGEIKPAPRPKPVPPPTVAPTPAAVSVLPINEKEIHAAELNGTSPAPSVAEAKTESPGPRTGDAKSPTVAPTTSAAAAASSAASSTVKKEPVPVAKTVVEPKQQPRTPEPPKPAPASPKQPIAKVQPINQGPAPSSFSTKPYRPDPAVQRTDSFTEERSSKIWIWAGVAVLALLLLVWALRPKHATTVAGPTAPSSSAQTKAGGNAWETKTIQPDGTASSNVPATESKAAPAANPPRQAASKATGRAREQNAPAPVAKESAARPETSSAKDSVWRTVIYTYNRQADANEKAKSLNAQHSDLHAEVFSPSGNHGPYLVCAGGGMSKEDATDMRKRAVGMGLPRDSYIQNFKH